MTKKDVVEEYSDKFGGWKKFAREMFPLVGEQELERILELRKRAKEISKALSDGAGRKRDFFLGDYWCWLDSIKSQQKDRHMSRRAVISELVEQKITKKYPEKNRIWINNKIDTETTRVEKLISTMSAQEKRMRARSNKLGCNI